MERRYKVTIEIIKPNGREELVETYEWTESEYLRALSAASDDCID